VTSPAPTQIPALGVVSRSLCGLALLAACSQVDVVTPEVEFHLMGTADTTADATRPFQVERAGDGFIVLRTSSGPLPQRLDRQGHSVGSLGRFGSGPQELRSVSRIFAWQDSLFLVDRELARLHVFAATGAFARSVPIGAGWQPLSSQALMFSPDTFVVSGSTPTEMSHGLPFHLLDSTGTVVRSWGATDRSFDGTDPFGLVQTLAKASDTSFWAARPDSLTFRHWHIDGRLIQELSVAREWFVQGAEFIGPVDQHRPPARIAALSVDGCGSLIVVFARPRDDWAPAPRVANPGVEGRFPPYGEYAHYIYQRVEILDPVHGKLQAAATRRDTLIAGFMADGWPFGFWTDGDGRQLAVWWEMDTHTHC